MIATDNRSGVSYLELYVVQEEFPERKGAYSYLLRDGGIIVKARKTEEDWRIVFPAAIRKETWQDIAYSTAMMEEGKLYKVYTPEVQDKPEKASLADELRTFYENAALYRVLSHTSDEIVVTYDAQAIEANPVTAPEQSDVFDKIYKGKFKVKIGEGDRVTVILMQ